LTFFKECHNYGKVMPRTPNSVKTITITVSTTPPVHGFLEQLVATGLFGKNPAEAAERLIARGIEQHLRERTLLDKGPIGGHLGQ
jgi:hypothetical protein